MADLDPQTAELPAPEPSPEAAREQHAEQALERALERAGVPEVAEPTPEPDRAPQTHSSLESREPAAPPTSEPHPRVPLHLHPASQGFFSRVDRRAEGRVLERIARAAEILEQGGVQPAAAAAQAAKDEDPQPRVDTDDPASVQNWYAWRRRQDQRDLDQRLAPITERFQREDEQREQQEQWQAQQRRQAEFNHAMEQELAFAAETYAQVPEGKDFQLRFDWYVNDVMAEGLRRVGFPPQKALEVARINAMALTNLALQNRINPALFIDQIIAAGVESTVSLLMDAGYQAPAGQPASPQRRNGNGHQPRQQQEIRTLQETAAGARSVSSGPRTAGASPKGGASGISAVIADPSVENIKAWANEEYGGDTRAATRALRRAMAMAQA